MNYLRYLATLLANGTFVISVFSVMPRTPTINYVPSLPVTVTTAQHVMIHLHPQIRHHLLKRPLGRLHSVLLHQRPKHPLGLHTQSLFPVPGSRPLTPRIGQGILLARADVSQRRAGSRQSGARSRPTNLSTMGGKVGSSGRTGRGAKGVDTDTSVGEVFGGEGSDGRGTLASRRWRRERSPRLASNSNIEGEFERRVSCKDGQAGDHATGKVLHGTPMFINKVIKLRLKNIILDR